MNHKKVIIAISAIAIVLVMSTSAFSLAPHHSGLPKTDEILYKVYEGVIPDVIVDEFITGTTDWIGGPGRIDLYDRVVAAGHNVSPEDPMAEFGFMPINCRDYKQTSGAVNKPLNDSDFRLALSYIYGMDTKQTDIFDYVGATWTYALGNPCPDAQEPWYDPTTVMPNTDWSTAESLLTAAGYYVAATGSGDWLHNPDGDPVRSMEVMYSTGALYWERGPGLGFVRAFNDFILTHMSAAGPLLTLLPVDFTTLVFDLLVYRDFDFICIGLTNLGVYVDWMYDCFHSSNMGVWGWNFCGIVDSEFDAWGVTIMTSLIEAEIITAAENVQDKFVYELMPWFPMSSGREFCTTANDGRGELMNLISMNNYGPRNDYSWSTLHWRGTPGVDWPGGTLKTALGDAPDTLNPFTDNTLYGWQFMDRAIEGLLARDPSPPPDPESLTLMPWIATNWTVASFTSIPEFGIVDGSTATFFIRQDVSWQDGEPLTAYDCVNNMRILREYHPGRYSGTWANLAYEEAEGLYKFNVYFYAPSLYYAVFVAGTSLLAPKHVTDVVEQWVADGVISHFFDWTPADDPYVDLGLGAPPTAYPWMKQIVGTGPFVFDNYDAGLSTGRVARNQEYWINAPVIGGCVGEWRIENCTNYEYMPLVQNIAAKSNDELGEVTDATVNVLVYEDDVLTYTVNGINLAPWKWQYLGPYTISTVTGGEHTVKVEVWESGVLIHTYVHRYQACPRWDVTTIAGSTVDHFIDIKDILKAAIAYGSYPMSLKWDRPADVNEDLFVDIKDILAVAMQYGTGAPWSTCP